jgi:hypothetical protein
MFMLLRSLQMSCNPRRIVTVLIVCLPSQCHVVGLYAQRVSGFGRQVAIATRWLRRLERVCPFSPLLAFLAKSLASFNP